jgi:AcrR family transcriptional regulator
MTNAVIDSVDSTCYNPAEMGNGASAANLGAGRGRPRRAPPPEERQRDAHRSRQLLLAAALEEFAARGFAGARVQDIANRAGINKQLITYYFGGKDGLYREIQRRWLEREASSVDPDVALDEAAARYLHDVLANPRLSRLMVWRGLADPAEVPPDASPERQDLSSMRRRQARGELAPDLDPGAVLLALMGAIMAPIAIPHMVQKILGLDPHSPEFERHYGDQLRRIVRHLAGGQEFSRSCPGT